jgi:hypothetical protein
MAWKILYHYKENHFSCNGILFFPAGYFKIIGMEFINFWETIIWHVQETFRFAGSLKKDILQVKVL